jgi:hypothetical protein
LCTTSCSTGSSDIPHSGTWFAWFGGLDPADSPPDELGTLSQTFTASGNASGTLSFWLFMNEQSGVDSDYLKVKIDGTTVYTVTNAQVGSFPTYTLVNVPITGDVLADTSSHTLLIESFVDGSGNTNFFLDDVSLDLTGVSCSPDAASWVRAVPNSGTIAADGSANVALEFNTNGLAAGLHTVNLCIQTNDTARPNVQIPVTINVTENVDPTRKIYLPMVSKN